MLSINLINNKSAYFDLYCKSVAYSFFDHEFLIFFLMNIKKSNIIRVARKGIFLFSPVSFGWLHNRIRANASQVTLISIHEEFELKL